VKLDLSDPARATSAGARALAAYAKENHALLVADGVDSAASETAARELGCTHGRGRLLGPATPAVDPAL
jgi:EAL domain-containing protein (putative c-di-GMP-specific phosphodiesterase class I)